MLLHRVKLCFTVIGAIFLYSIIDTFNTHNLQRYDKHSCKLNYVSVVSFNIKTVTDLVLIYVRIGINLEEYFLDEVCT